jgi:hypothetical protein
MVSGVPADPIYRAIDNHKKASEKVTEAAKGARRLSKIADKKVGDWRKLPEERRAEYIKFLDSISPNGDHDSIVEGPADIAADAMSELAQTIPASREGFVALAIYAGAVIRDRESTFCEDGLRDLLLSLADAAGELRKV